MTITQAKQRIEKLRGEIEHHRHLYHVLDRQEISDAALDSLKHELVKLEEAFPSLVTPDSPSQRVGGLPLVQFDRVRHESSMLSLNDAFGMDELSQWEERINKIVRGPYEYFVELKIDGVAVALVYNNGILHHAATRGDGATGEDVTQNIRTVESVPLRLREIPGVAIASRVEVRGEIYICKKDFEEMNQRQVESGKAAFANPRNIAAGSIRQLDPSIAASRPLRFIAWEITNGCSLKTREEEYTVLANLGFPVPPKARRFSSIGTLKAYIDKEDAQRARHPFQVDGLVIKVNDLRFDRRLGVVGKAPRGSIAYKFTAEEGTTIVNDIVVQVGRTGALTPVAILRPVRIAGSSVSRATLHNAHEVARKDVRVGDTVIVRKAGDIIPEVVSVLPLLRPKDARSYRFPSRCPVCRSPVVSLEGGVIIRCTNDDCFSQRRERILHAVGKDGFDIEGLGEKIIEQFLAEGLVSSVPDLWKLTEEDLISLEGFAELSSKKLVREIQSKKTISLSSFLVVLGIPNVGVVTAQDIARTFRFLEQVRIASREKYMSVDGIGEKVADGIVAFWSDNATKKLLERYSAVDIAVIPERNAGPLSGKSFVFTGSLGTMTRSEAKGLVLAQGGKITGSVGKDVDFAVVGDDAGSKAARAKQLGVHVLTPKQFFKLVRQ